MPCDEATMSKMILLDQKACTGCRQCELMCSVHHTGTANPARARIQVIKWEADGFYLPMYCLQCMEPVCAAACPKGAITRNNELGRVIINYNLCIGCMMCTLTCPFGAIGVDTQEKRVIKCNHCDGEPVCVSFCEAKALQYVDADTVHIARKRQSSNSFTEFMSSQAKKI